MKLVIVQDESQIHHCPNDGTVVNLADKGGNFLPRSSIYEALVF